MSPVLRYFVYFLDLEMYSAAAHRAVLPAIARLLVEYYFNKVVYGRLSCV